jgi:hypothetical protein
MTINETWLQLEASPPPGGGGIMARRIHPEAAVDLFLAVEKPTNARVLILRVKGATVAGKVDLPKAEGFEVCRGFVSLDGKKYCHLSVRLTHPRYGDVFTTLVEDVVKHVLPAPGDPAAVRFLLERLGRWQAFLKRHAPDGLGEESQQGLYGELWFLSHHVIPRLGPRAAVCCWKGPTGAPQDFQTPSVSVEVKTASGKQHQTLAISNERQLDSTGVKMLVLFHLSVDVREGAGETLPARVGAVRVLVEADAVAAEELERLLFEAGYLDCHTQTYETRGYTIRETNLFEVRDGFPRIVEADLPNGVGDVRYTISVAECRHYAVPEGRVHQLLDEAARGN